MFSFVCAIPKPCVGYLFAIRMSSARTLCLLRFDHSRHGCCVASVLPFLQSRHHAVFRHPANSVIWNSLKPNFFSAAIHAASNCLHLLIGAMHNAATMIRALGVLPLSSRYTTWGSITVILKSQSSPALRDTLATR